MSKYDTFVYDDEGRYLRYACTFAINTGLSGTRSYTYDAQGRLTGETFSPLHRDTTYNYDAAGNHPGTFHGATLTTAPSSQGNPQIPQFTVQTPQTPA